MSDIDIVTILFGLGDLVSAFNSGKKLIKIYKHRKAKKTYLEIIRTLETSLLGDSSAVKSIYDASFI
jgi:hypothetical protein